MDVSINLKKNYELHLTALLTIMTHILNSFYHQQLQQHKKIILLF